MPALQLAKVGEKRGHLTTGVLVDAVQPHEGVEDQQPRLQLGNREGKAAPIGLEIETQRRGGDDLDIEIGELHTRGGGNALEPPTHDWQGIFCGIEQDAAGVRHSITAQARDAGGDRNGKIERQERLAALGLAAFCVLSWGKSRQSILPVRWSTRWTSERSQLA